MARLPPPILFSKSFGIEGADLSRLGVFDPTLNVDSQLFPDPLLLERSQHPELRRARETFDRYFEQVMRLLHGIQEDQDKCWRTAFQKLSFPEVKGTCLGFGAGTIAGSGSGPGMARRLVETGRQIVSMGIDDPDLFMAMGLFESDFGPDLIGDMLTNVTLSDIIAFNERVLSELGLDGHDFQFKLKNGTKHGGKLLRNPVFTGHDVPLILMPSDILRDLPIATCWREVQQVSEENEEFRSGLNGSIAELWSKKSLKEKDALKRWALSGSNEFGSLLDMLHGHDGKPYDFLNDPNGELVWRTIGPAIASKYPVDIEPLKALSQDEVLRVVVKIIEQFRFLIEERDLWRELYAAGKPRFEKSAQRIFYVVAQSYCQANGLDVTPEAETGRGPVDFKFSNGISSRVLVEIKLSTNTKLIQGYKKQLPIYNKAERPFSSFYIVLDVGSLGDKLKQLNGLSEENKGQSLSAPTIVYIDGTPKRSASTA